MAKLTLSFRSKPINAYFFETGQSICIGRNEDNDIFIDSLAIEPVHAKITFNDSVATIEPANEISLVQVNGDKIASADLQHGDRISIGKHTLEYSEEKPAIEIENVFDSADPDFEAVKSKLFQRKSRLGKLQVLRGAKVGHVIPLSNSLMRIGKDDASEVEFVRCSDGYYLSATRENEPGAIQVNSEPINNQTLKIADGDYLKIDNAELLFFEE